MGDTTTRTEKMPATADYAKHKYILYIYIYIFIFCK